jgi:biotin operon repressor
MESSKDKILKLLKIHDTLTSSFLADELEITRQTVAKHLKTLLEENLISKAGSTKSAVYSYGGSQNLENEVTLVKTIKGLEEHIVYKELELRMSLSKHLNKNAQSIAFYAFGEMLNNAIDHSGAEKVEIHTQINKSCFEFKVKDLGVGVFYNIQKYYKLEDEFEAVSWLLSGKKTTMPSRHSGEGIFFTSKISDHFSLKSHKTFLNFYNPSDDISLSEIKNVKGTEVLFSIRCHTKKKLETVFTEFANEDFEFDKSKSIVKITSGRAAVSRSQARRLLASLGDFKRIVLDLSGVNETGQAFCDEIFRVYKLRNPEKIISWENASAAAEFMIQRSLKR